MPDHSNQWALFATLAMLALVASVQFTFWARLWAVTPDDIRSWWDDAAKPDGRHELIIETKQFGQVHRAYSSRARSSYNAIHRGEGARRCNRGGMTQRPPSPGRRP